MTFLVGFVTFHTDSAHNPSYPRRSLISLIRSKTMNNRTVAWVALALWVITVATFAWFFVRGNTTVSSDGRSNIMLSHPERDLVLSEMRGLLVAMQGIVEGINQNDPQKITRAARAAGMAAAADVNPVLMAKLPMDFKQLGMSVHHDMDAIAQAAETGKSPADLSKMLENTLPKCIACHASWQLKAKQ